MRYVNPSRTTSRSSSMLIFMKMPQSRQSRIRKMPVDGNLGGLLNAALLELDNNIEHIINKVRADAPNAVTIVTADNSAWQDAYSDAEATPSVAERLPGFEQAGACRVGCRGLGTFRLARSTTE